MPLVNREIVLPFMYQSLVVVVDVGPESHRVVLGILSVHSKAAGTNRASIATHAWQNQAGEILSLGPGETKVSQCQSAQNPKQRRTGYKLHVACRRRTKEKQCR